MKLVTYCSLCGEKSLHIIEKDGEKMLQCFYCGYASSDSLLEGVETDVLEKAGGLAQKYKKVVQNRTWIPGVMTLPEGMIYLIEENDQPKWAFAVMVSIPEEEQSKYPDGDGGYHTKRYDTDNQTVFSKFYECIEFLNQARQILDNAKQIQS